jgi:hypothetical protein
MAGGRGAICFDSLVKRLGRPLTGDDIGTLPMTVDGTQIDVADPVTRDGNKEVDHPYLSHNPLKDWRAREESNP